MTPSDPFDPKRHVFTSPELKDILDEVVHFFSSTPVHPLPPPARFTGVGVYGLYYIGPFGPYRPLVKNSNKFNIPIYVGKAVPAGWRTARSARTSTSTELYRRLNEHSSRSIRYTTNLKEEDFFCRFVILNDVEANLITGAEAHLIRIYQPLWNCVVDGFGNHDPGSGRYNQAPSEWDILHPGRPWVQRLTGVAPLQKQIMAKIAAALKN